MQIIFLNPPPLAQKQPVSVERRKNTTVPAVAEASMLMLPPVRKDRNKQTK